MKITKEPQYQLHFNIEESHGRSYLGLGSNATWTLDPKRLTFVLARYKFISKMIDCNSSVLEVGCGDGFASRIVAHSVKKLTLTDFDSIYVEEAKKQLNQYQNCDFAIWNPLESKYSVEKNAIYALDVLEHINPLHESIFISNIKNSLSSDGIFIVGLPSIESQPYASQGSKEGHINCKSGEELRELMNQYFKHIFLFSMNDEIVHTGFSKMANYIFAMCVTPK